MNLPQYHRFESRALKAIAKLESLLPDRTTQSKWFGIPSITRRQSSPSVTCNANSNTQSGPCEKTFDGTNLSIPIAVGIVVPITLALVALLILHRRHVKRLRREDATDRHKSLDFGMDPADAQLKGRNKKNGPPEMRDMEKGGQKASRKGRGMSMDLPNPYLLPPELQESRESLHSLSRTIHSGEDRYRPATTFIQADGSSPRIGSSLRDDSSIFTGSSSRRGQKQDGMNENLLKNAQRMSHSMPPTQRSSLDSTVSGIPQIRAPPATLAPARKGLPSNPRDTSRRTASPERDKRDSYAEQVNSDLRSSNNYLGAYIHRGEQPTNQEQLQNSHHQQQSPLDKPLPQVEPQSQSPPPAITVTHDAPSPPRQESLQAHANQAPYNDNGQSYGYTNEYEYPQYENSSYDQEQEHHSPEYQHDYSHQSSELSTPYYTPGGLAPETNLTPYSTYKPDFNDRRLSILRPLPPDDPTDNPEQRANRIRSFYKEYFDDSKPAKAYQPAPEIYYEDYGEEFQGNGTVFDPASGQFVVAQAPYAEPITRRAMTPPPRGPPRFQGRDRAYSNLSNQSLGPPRSRAFSSASGRYGPGPRGPPAKALPPPAALRTLPTPHQLKEDTYFLQGLDFAPPTSFRDRQAGRPESPTGSARPYQPLVPAHIPLASAFNELPAIPSPYQLRKSGSFTALDFAPPPRFKNNDGASDAGSIRSGRSNGSAMSASQIHSIRSGAYRVSRIPKEVVGTKQDLLDSLKPTWGQRPHDA